MRDLDDARRRRPDSPSQRHASRCHSASATVRGTRARRRSPRRWPAPVSNSRLSTAILQEMWEKWVFIATTAGITCLMRATVGDIVAAKAGALTTSLLDECAAIAAGQRLCAERSDPGAQPNHVDRARLRFCRVDAARHRARRADRGRSHHRRFAATRRGLERDYPLLRIAYTHLKAYEARRSRETAAAPAA